VLDALEQALHERRPLHRGSFLHHSDTGSQYISIHYTGPLVQAGIEPPVGSVGDRYDNALAETTNSFYKTEVFHRRGPRRSLEAVEFATLKLVNCFNHRRLLESNGNIPPPEAEALHDAAQENLLLAAWPEPNSLRRTQGGSLLQDLDDLILAEPAPADRRSPLNGS
jgi:transposase InsO family protein